VAQLTGYDVVELVTAQIAGAEERIERVYEWQFDRLMAAVRAMSVIAASIVATLGTAFFEENVQMEWWLAVVLVVDLSASVAIAVFSFARLGRIRREYLANLSVLGVTRQRRLTRP
jgi:hypothetical protein